ncbi:ABC transporter ATP-binding protein [Kordiimonas laminariae]|uniref:ABC transporter ATP-binding protein n=1 Tax=Kordiimonas laminariae TaxID=2917717 RepID=UPI001FF55390|nr:ABC transporter ATP-binding protein [Kordiimonas laminariae]MCK0070619.1 ABC transporter ATP-binding protein [Kordiimonas laminariae]
MPTDSETPLIETKELRHSYSDQEILYIKSWCLHEGENQLLLGASGCGKTTLISLLSGLSKPSSGDIWVNGILLSGLQSGEIDRLRASMFGLIFQDYHLVSSLNVYENITLPQQFTNQPTDKGWAEHLLKRLGLTDKKHTKPSALSHGEAQRVAIARAAMCQPPVVIADEPTSALDDENTAHVMELLNNLCAEWGATLLVASHDKRIKPFFEKRLILKSQETSPA